MKYPVDDLVPDVGPYLPLQTSNDVIDQVMTIFQTSLDIFQNAVGFVDRDKRMPVLTAVGLSGLGKSTHCMRIVPKIIGDRLGATFPLVSINCRYLNANSDLPLLLFHSFCFPPPSSVSIELVQNALVSTQTMLALPDVLQFISTSRSDQKQPPVVFVHFDETQELFGSSILSTTSSSSAPPPKRTKAAHDRSDLFVQFVNMLAAVFKDKSVLPFVLMSGTHACALFNTLRLSPFAARHELSIPLLQPKQATAILDSFRDPDVELPHLVAILVDVLGGVPRYVEQLLVAISTAMLRFEDKTVSNKFAFSRAAFNRALHTLTVSVKTKREAKVNHCQLLSWTYFCSLFLN